MCRICKICDSICKNTQNNMQNMHNNMQKKVHCPYSAYSAYCGIISYSAYKAYWSKICWTESGPARHSAYSSVQQQLLIGHAKHNGHMCVSSWPFVPRKLQQTNRQDMVFIRSPMTRIIFSDYSDGAFQLRMDNIWFYMLTFPELSAINQRTVVMGVGGGTWTTGPLDGGPSCSGNKRWKPW